MFCVNNSTIAYFWTCDFSNYAYFSTIELNDFAYFLTFVSLKFVLKIMLKNAYGFETEVI